MAALTNQINEPVGFNLNFYQMEFESSQLRLRERISNLEEITQIAERALRGENLSTEDQEYTALLMGIYDPNMSSNQPRTPSLSPEEAGLDPIDLNIANLIFGITNENEENAIIVGRTIHLIGTEILR